MCAAAVCSAISIYSLENFVASRLIHRTQLKSVQLTVAGGLYCTVSYGLNNVSEECSIEEEIE